jgi:hypothetical protein
MYEIKCFDAFKRAFRRMVGMLFYPFAISKWFVLGFSAWLAIIFNSQGGSGIGGTFYFKFSSSSHLPYVVSRSGSFLKDVFLGDVFFVGKVCNYLKIEQSVFWLIVFGTAASVLLVVVINLILVWVSSRFKFIFIDNIANNRAEIAKPWEQFKKRGNSAFWWLFSFMLVSVLFMLIVFTIITSQFYPVILDYLRTNNFKMSNSSIIISALTMVAFVLGMVILSFTYYFFNEFVMPIMYKKDLLAKAAYREFLKLLKAAPLTFVKFWFLQIFANIVCGIAVILLIITTCGIVVIPLLIPYLWAIVILPVLVFQRSQSMELMAAFGPEYSPYPAPVESQKNDDENKEK